MVFYSLLFVACVIVAVVMLYLYHQLADVGKDVYKTLLPSSKTNPTNNRDYARVATSVNKTPTPWGWKAKTTQTKTARVRSVSPPGNVPWGWKGNDNEIREHGPKPAIHNVVKSRAAGLDAFLKQNDNEQNSSSASRENVGWPYREEKSEIAGKEYTMKRKAAPVRTNLRTTGKPWGW